MTSCQIGSVQLYYAVLVAALLCSPMTPMNLENRDSGPPASRVHSIHADGREEIWIQGRVVDSVTAAKKNHLAQL